jgi:adenylate cyclase
LSFVVLPFANLSNDPDQEYFADGVTDDLTTDLTRISGSFVIARNTAFTYKGKPVDVKQIGREFGIRYVIEGSVRRSGEEVQVNVQLIDTETGAHLWADRFDTDRTNLPKAQNEITRRLATSLHLRLIEAEGRRSEQETNPDARDMVMRGWAWYYRPVTEVSLQEAQRAFEQALELDRESIDARIGLATVLGDFVTLGLARAPKENEARSEQLLHEVFECDQSRPRAYFAVGRLRRLENRLIESQFELEKAVTLDRNYSGAFLQLGITTKYMAHPELALPYLQKAIELNPRQGNMVYYHYWLGMCHILLPGHTDEAIDFLRKARADSPRFWWTHLFLAAALGLGGDADEANAALAESLKLKPEISSFKSLGVFRAQRPWETNPPYTALVAKTIDVGLRRAGFPDE